MEVRSVFEADIEADDTVGVVRTMRAGREVVSDGEAGDAGPTVADLEKLERVDEGMDLLFREILLEDDGENAG